MECRTQLKPFDNIIHEPEHKHTNTSSVWYNPIQNPCINTTVYLYEAYNIRFCWDNIMVIFETVFFLIESHCADDPAVSTPVIRNLNAMHVEEIYFVLLWMDTNL